VARTVIRRDQKYLIEYDDVLGKNVATFTVADMHFRDDQGNWQPVDESIVDDASVPGFTASAVKQRHAALFGTAGEKRWYPRREVTTEYVEAAKPDYWRTQPAGWRPWNLSGLARSANHVDWDTADYHVGITNTWRRLKLDYILKTASAYPRVRFPLSFVGLTYNASTGEVTSIAEGVVVGYINSPTAHDANDAPVVVSATYAAGYYELVVTPGSAVYPITVDPTFTDQGTTSKDNCINGRWPTFNYGASTDINIGALNGTTGTPDHGLFQFDVSSIAATATCDSATLTLWLRDAGNANDTANNRAIQIYRVLRAWGEGTGGDGGTENQASASNWNYAVYNTVAWGTTGCSNTTSDREASSIGSHTLTTTDAANSSHDFALTASAVQDWWDGGLTNNGILLQADTEVSDFRKFHSAEETTSGDGTYRPKLVVVYTEAGGTALTPSPLAIPVAFAAPTLGLTYALAPTPLAVPVAFAAPSVGLAYALAPTPLAIPIGFAAPSIGLTYSLAPTPLAAPMAFAAPTVGLAYALTPDPLAVPLLFPAVTVDQAGTITLTPSPLAVPLAFGTPALAMGVKALTPSALAVPVAFGTPTVGLTLSLSPSPLAVPIAFAAPSLAMGAITLSPSPLAVPILTPGGTIGLGYDLTPTPVAVPLAFPGGMLAMGTLSLTPSPLVVLIVLMAPSIAGGALLVIALSSPVTISRVPNWAASISRSYQRSVKL
jgi:hypothetical protein